METSLDCVSREAIIIITATPAGLLILMLLLAAKRIEFRFYSFVNENKEKKKLRNRKS